MSISSGLKLFSDLLYCNPFLEKRDELEREILKIKSLKAFSSEDRWSYQPNPTLRKVLVIGDGLLEHLRSELITKGRFSKTKESHYSHLVYFIVYHEFVDLFDHIIRQTHEEGEVPKRITGYTQFSKRLNYFFKPTSDLSVESEYTASHLFACFFQVRRAFYHIFEEFIGSSSVAIQLMAEIWKSIFTHNMKRYQDSLYDRMGDIVTLITGPSGSGKELVARAIGLSRFIPFDEKKKQFEDDFLVRFHPVNLAALSSTLIESELFGHRRGSFTGAFEDKKGFIESCGIHGTVFLDEIGEASPEIQVKLLRALQSRQFQRLGDTEIHKFEGKIIAATNNDLSHEIAKGNFREDFYYRLCADKITTPSLFEMLKGNDEEMLFLVKHISKKVTGEEHADSLTKEVCLWINKKMPKGYSWPGNFRELEQCVRNILIRSSYYPERSGAESAEGIDGVISQLGSGSLTVKELNVKYIQHLYGIYGNYEEVSRRVDVDRRTVKKYVLGYN